MKAFKLSRPWMPVLTTFALGLLAFFTDLFSHVGDREIFPIEVVLFF